MENNTPSTSLELEQTQAHVGPHIPLIQGETVWGPITNVTLTLLVFLLGTTLVALAARNALKKEKSSKLKLFFLTFIQFFDRYLRDSFGDKAFARRYFPLIVGMFIIIFFGNMLGLIIDWFGISVSETILYYLRPIHSDVNTTLVLALTVVVYTIIIQVREHGGMHTTK